MAKKILNPAVDFYFDKSGAWQEAIRQLRMIVLDTGLTEELKWGCPCYSSHGSNIVLIHVFKEYCALLFFKGALLKDTKNILIQQTKNVQAARQVRFTNIKDIVKQEKTLKAYIQQAVDVEKSGLKVDLKKTTEYDVPEEFRNKLNKQPALKAAFAALTPGRQRAYLLHFAEAKQAATREARVEKYIPQILSGKGLND